MLEEILQYLRNHPKRVIGAGLGLVFGVCLVVVGFWKTLVISLMCALGYYVGKWADERKGWREFLEEKLPGRPDFR